MSFGTSSADIDTVVAFCRALYRRCRDAGGEYEEISHEVRGLHTVLKHLRYEVEAPDSLINDTQSKWSRQLSPIVGNCDDTLHELNELVQEHDLTNETTKPTRGDFDRRGSDLDTLGIIRVKILGHKSKLTKFLDNIQLQEERTPRVDLDNEDGHLDTILDKVDIIAARIQSRNGRPKRNEDDTEVWKQFRRELSQEGFSTRVLEQHKDVLRAYIREIDQQGLLDEVPTSSQPTTASTSDAHRWLDVLKSSKKANRPPSFSSMDLASENSSSKAITREEENTKFPLSTKVDLEKADSSSRPRRTSNDVPRQPQIPRLITSTEDDDQAVQHFNPNVSSENDSDHKSRNQTNNKRLGEVIKTTQLIAYSQALQLHPHSPSSFRSTQSHFDSEFPSRALTYQPKKALEYTTSPLQPGTIQIPVSTPRTNSGFNTISRAATFRIAPDEHGNEIPADAKWTKINRRLVSPEVLDQDHLRYEARPEFVAILGVFSRAEIESLAERSRILRDARHRRSLPVQKPPPAQPPRPIPIPTSHPQSRPRCRNANGRDTPSPSSYSSSESESADEDYEKRRPGKGKSHERRGYAGSNTGVYAPTSGYPNPYGQPLPLPSPVKSPSRPSHLSSRHENYSPTTKPRNRDREKEYERDDSRHRRYQSSSSTSRSKGDRDRNRDRERDRAREKDKERAYQKSSRWKENLTAAGIGGAAVSLLNVLSEAAEGL